MKRLAEQVIIDPEFRALIPPLSGDERAQLESNLVADGCRDPLVLWAGKDILIDGHNRYDICTRLGIPFKTTLREFVDRESVLLWIEENQLGRRNLTDDQRGAIAHRIKERRSEIAKRERAREAGKQGGRGNTRENRQSLSDTVADKLSDPRPKRDTRAAVAKEASVSERKLRTIAEIEKAKPGTVDRIAAGKVTVKDAAREVRREQREQKRQDAAAEAAKILPDDDFGVRHGDFREIGKELADESVDLIFTDPPYDRKTLPLYGDMAKLAARVLKPGGSLICYLGQFQIHDVCNLVTPHLRLWWTLACLHGDGPFARMTEYGIIVKWKPMLWFVKGTRGDKHTFVEDSVSSPREKDVHDWQQGLGDASYYIDKLTLPGGMVFDPFCGGATTAVAAKSLFRRWLTCDVDEATVKIARARIAREGTR